VRGGGGGRLDVRDHDRVGGRRERRDRGCRRASHGRAERRDQPGGGVALEIIDGDRARYRGGEGSGNRIRACAAGGGVPDVRVVYVRGWAEGDRRLYPRGRSADCKRDGRRGAHAGLILGASVRRAACAAERESAPRGEGGGG